MKIRVFALIVLFVSMLGYIGCPTYSDAEEKLVTKNQERLLKAQPPVSLKWSLERRQINKRTELWNSENKISYIYLIDKGVIITFYSIKGKVSSVNSQITNPMTYHRNGTTLPSPAEDGSYGSNGDAIFFFTQSGVYVEWNGVYMLADQPLKLAQKPLLYKEIK